MPRKRALEPEKLKLMIDGLEAKYGEDIFLKLSNLYLFCFSTNHSVHISKLQRLDPKITKHLMPFVKNGEREMGMVYVYFLSDFLEGRGKYRGKWDDMIFIIYFTFYTGLAYEDRSHLNLNTLRRIANNEQGLAFDSFRKKFSKVSRYNFHNKKSLNNEKIKRSLIENFSSFKKKMKKFEQVELFANYLRKIIENGQ